ACKRPRTAPFDLGLCGYPEKPMIDTKVLENAVQDLRSVLRDGLVATDIWDRGDGLSLAGFNQQPVAVALFTRITTELESSLADSNFPPLARYYLLDMEG